LETAAQGIAIATISRARVFNILPHTTVTPRFLAPQSSGKGKAHW
jgi:hypothetical protein